MIINFNALGITITVYTVLPRKNTVKFNFAHFNVFAHKPA